MTDGIIQKVVDSYYGRAHINVLEGIKQELIAEIRKELNVTDSRLPTWYNQLMRHKLTGDNQEDNNKLSEDDFED